MLDGQRQPHPHGTAAVPCPCCGQTVDVPSLEMVIDRYRLSPQQSSILRVLWRAKGMPVTTQRIFDAMYADDPDGGPTAPKMYEAFKFALHHLRNRLAGSRYWIESAGYGMGFRLMVGKRAERHGRGVGNRQTDQRVRISQ